MKIEWTGDLSDDCFAQLGDVTAHVEALGDVHMAEIDQDGKVSRRKCDRWRSAHWFVGVYRGDETLYHSGEHGGLITSDDGDQARAIAEAIMRAAQATEGARDE